MVVVVVANRLLKRFRVGFPVDEPLIDDESAAFLPK